MMDLETPLDSSVNREGDDVYLRIRNEVRIGSRLAIPRDVVIKGMVSRVQPCMVNGKKREAELHIQLGEIGLTDGGILKAVSEPIKLDTRDNIEPTGAARLLNGSLQGLSQSAPAIATGVTYGVMHSGSIKHAAYGAAAGAGAAATAGLVAGTHLMDALDEALGYLYQAAPDHRRAVILISDNLEGDSFTPVDRVVQTALESETVVYSLKMTERKIPHGIGSSILGLPIPRIPVPSMGEGPVSTITRDTGGHLFSVSSSAIESVFHPQSPA